MRSLRALLITTTIVLVGAVAGCGGGATKAATPAQGDTSNVEQKLGVCLAEAAYMGTDVQPDCDPATLQASPYTPASVTCVYKSGNDYICQATAPSEDSQIAEKINGSYDVTWDGAHIEWQQ